MLASPTVLEIVKELLEIFHYSMQVEVQQTHCLLNAAVYRLSESM